MIILALTSRQSVGQMFIAGILPGLLLSSLFVGYILIRCYIQKDMGPSVPPDDRLPAAERLRLLRALLLPVSLVFAVMGSMFFGLATPSEASAIGALGAIVQRGDQAVVHLEELHLGAVHHAATERDGHLDCIRRLGVHGALCCHRCIHARR